MHMPSTRMTIKIICLLFCVSLCFQAAFALDNEVWISPVGIGPFNVPVTNASSVDTVYGNLVLYPSNIVGTATYPFRCPSASTLNYVLQTVLTNTNMTIHFMAGTFQVPATGVAPLNGWKIRGAGIDSTIMQFAAGSTTAGAFGVIGASTGNTEGVEVSDLTVDCNLANQTSIGGQLGAVTLWGSQTRISRVKAINWGTDNTDECFVFYIAPSWGNTYATNCVIEDCIVTQPAYQTGSGGVVAIGIAPSIKAAIARNNMVYNIQTVGSGLPAHLYALGGSGVVNHNYVNDVTGTGACAVYADSYSPRDVVISDNVFDNVYDGIYYNMQNSTLTNIVLKDNVIRPAEGGAGINYYTGSLSQSNYYVTNLVVKNNIIYPSYDATNITAFALNSYASASVVDNIFQGGGSGYDVFMQYDATPNWVQSIYPYPLQLNTWTGNINLLGTELTETNDAYWQPGDEDSIVFTPTNSGWYRLIIGVAEITGKIKIESDFWDNYNTAIEFWYREQAYTSTTNNMGTVVETLQGGYEGGSSQVTKARVGSDGPYPASTVYLDIYIPNWSFSSARSIKVTSEGHFRSKLLNPPIYNPATPVLTITNNL